jgi:hypothetical protein
MALNECECGCGDAHHGGAKNAWSVRLETILDHVSSTSGRAVEPPHAQTAAVTAEDAGAAPSFFISLDAVALPSGVAELDGRLQLIISPAGVVSEPRLHVSSDRCESPAINTQITFNSEFD